MNYNSFASSADFFIGLDHEFITPINEFLASHFEVVSPKVFYRDIFPVGSLENCGEYVEGRYNAIACEIIKTEETSEVRRFTITDELSKIDELTKSEHFVITSPISYAGKARTSKNARFLHALAIDIDGIVINDDFFAWGVEKLLKQMHGLEHNKVPMATYLVSSGTGLHAYWVFQKPIPLFPNVVKELEKYKRRLTWQIWSQGCSLLHDKIQYESLFQGFRMVGTKTKNGGTVRAYKVGDKVDFAYLNSCVPNEFKADIRTYKSDLTLKQAKEKYPEWYEARIVKKQRKGRWVNKRALYDWWIEKIKSGANVGHRYWCIMALATYAKKCDIPFDELKQDAENLLPLLEEKTTDENNHFTVDDTHSALKAYSEDYVTYPIKTIVNRTDIPIEKNKRNGRKQSEHLRADYWFKDDIPESNVCKNNREIKLAYMREKGLINGRPSKEKLVKDYLATHRGDKKINIAKAARELNVSRDTIYKYLNA